MKTFFRSYTYTWWQIAILKVALFSIGILAGGLLAEFLAGWWWLLTALAIVGAGYILWLSFKPHSPTRT